jgi:hypothetical protein
MRTSIIMVAVTCGVFAATALVGSKPAEAAGGAYCLEYNMGGSDCGFTSLTQCNATASGIGAECYAVAPTQEAMAAIPRHDRRARVAAR